MFRESTQIYGGMKCFSNSIISLPSYLQVQDYPLSKKHQILKENRYTERVVSNNTGCWKVKEQFRACNMLAKNQINRNKLDNKAKSDNKNLDFMPFIQNDIKGHIEFE